MKRTSVLALSLASVSVIFAGCPADTNSTGPQCPNGACAVVGRYSPAYYAAGPESKGKELTMKNKNSGEVLARTETGDHGYFRFSNVDEIALLGPGADDNNPPPVIVCDPDGNCFDFQPLPGMGCGLEPIPVPEDPPIGYNCGIAVLDPGSGGSPTAGELSSELLNSTGLVSVPGTAQPTYAVATARDAGTSQATGRISGKLKMNAITASSRTASAELQSATAVLVQVGTKRVVSKTSLASKSADQNCDGGGWLCFSFSSVPQGKYELEVWKSDGTGEHKLSQSFSSVELSQNGQARAKSFEPASNHSHVAEEIEFVVEKLERDGF